MTGMYKGWGASGGMQYVRDSGLRVAVLNTGQWLVHHLRDDLPVREKANLMYTFDMRRLIPSSERVEPIPVPVPSQGRRPNNVDITQHPTGFHKEPASCVYTQTQRANDPQLPPARR